MARLAMIGANAREVGQFECDVLDDVSKVSTFFKPRHKTAGPAEAAMMTLKVGKNFEELPVETVKLTTLPFEQLAKIQSHDKHRAITKDIRTGKWANAFDLHEFVPLVTP